MKFITERLNIKKNNSLFTDVIFILGQTASGKSRLVKEISKNFDIELVSADSIQIYKGLDIGSAKPTKEEQQLFKHHLIDIRDFNESFTIAEFYKNAKKTIQEILSKGKTPIISGGTFYYIRSLIEGLSTTPCSNPQIKKTIQDELDSKGLKYLYDKLVSLDKEYAVTISQNDKQRITRALEIIYISGQKVSSFKNTESFLKDYNYKIYFIETDKDTISENIKKRAELMFEKGLKKEVESLVNRGAKPIMQSMKAIGYREWFDENGCIKSDDKSVKEEIIKDTRQYAKRQRTFVNLFQNVTRGSYSNILSSVLTTLSINFESVSR